MEGLQLIKLKGFITYPKLMIVGPYDSPLYTATINIPTDDGNKPQTLKIATFTCAEELAEIPENTFMYMEGHLEVKPSPSACPNCGHSKAQYWTNIIIDTFEILNYKLN